MRAQFVRRVHGTLSWCHGVMSWQMSPALSSFGEANMRFVFRASSVSGEVDCAHKSQRHPAGCNSWYFVTDERGSCFSLCMINENADDTCSSLSFTQKLTMQHSEMRPPLPKVSVCCNGQHCFLRVKREGQCVANYVRHCLPYVASWMPSRIVSSKTNQVHNTKFQAKTTIQFTLPGICRNWTTFILIKCSRPMFLLNRKEKSLAISCVSHPKEIQIRRDEWGLLVNLTCSAFHHKTSSVSSVFVHGEVCLHIPIAGSSFSGAWLTFASLQMKKCTVVTFIS